MPPLPRPEGRPRFARWRDVLGRALLVVSRVEHDEVAEIDLEPDVEHGILPRVGRSHPSRTRGVRRARFLGVLLIHESAWRGDTPHGPEVWHSWRGDARRRVEWRDGVPHGAWREWHGNGVKALECTLERGRLHGKCSAWRRDGTKEFQGEYREGQKTGEWYYLHRDGTLDRERTGLYVEGERLSGIKGFNEWLGSP